MDGVAPPASDAAAPAVAEAPVAAVPPPVIITPSVLALKKAILFVVAAAYLMYGVWGAFLLSVLPSSTQSSALVSAGVISSIVGAAVLVATGFLLFIRVTKSRSDAPVKQRSLIKMIAFVVPGLALSAAVPYMITREPPLSLQITSPTSQEEFVAPLAVTWSAQSAAETLQRLGLRPLQYTWDTNGDGKADNQTVTPETTVIYDRQGIYQATVSIKLDNGETRRATRRLVIPAAVFSLTPNRPIVEKPVRFSVADLIADLKTLEEVQWDFDGDGTVDQVTKTPDALYTYYSTGPVEASAAVKILNNTQTTYKRLFTVEDPPVLPFPVTLIAEPRMLIGPAPFGVIFRIETEEPLKEIQWIFGDGKEEKGSDLRRIGHSFESPGIYPVLTKIRSASGELAEITTLVRATQDLPLPDLRFSGTPEVRNNTVTGEVPLTVELTPQTSTPLIEFSWDDPEAGGNQPQGTTVKQVYRREGTYSLYLIAQDPEGKVMRKPITVKVNPPSAEPTIRIQPDGGVAPLEVLLDASDTFIPTGQEIAGFKWRFGDETGGTTEQLGASRVEHTYTAVGEYVIQLTIVMADGKEYTANRTLVVRKPSLSACLTSSRVKVQKGKGIEFDAACSTGIVSRYLWDVRKNSAPDVPVAQGADEQYIHVFEDEGEYTVSVTVSDSSGNQDKKSLSITVTP